VVQRFDRIAEIDVVLQTFKGQDQRVIIYKPESVTVLRDFDDVEEGMEIASKNQHVSFRFRSAFPPELVDGNS